MKFYNTDACTLCIAQYELQATKCIPVHLKFITLVCVPIRFRLNSMSSKSIERKLRKKTEVRCYLKKMHLIGAKKVAANSNRRRTIGEVCTSEVG